MCAMSPGPMCWRSRPDAREAGVYNVASGRPRPLLDMARLLCDAAGPDAPAPEITGQFRLGDVRHVFADAGKAREQLGFQAEVELEAGMREFAVAELR